MQTIFFEFESDFVAKLRCVPMIVRYKLDVVGIKLSLRAWSRFTFETRAQLAKLPAESPTDIAHYADFVSESIESIGETPAPVPASDLPHWTVAHEPPQIVVQKANALGVSSIEKTSWQGLSDLQRFALLKLTRDGHENVNFLPALQEFGLTHHAAA